MNTSLCAGCKFSHDNTDEGNPCELGRANVNGRHEELLDPFLADYVDDFKEFPMVEVVVTDCEKYIES